MDHSVSSLSYQGSIVEAIVEAKRQKKLLVVYISGENAESGQLQESTWTNSIVADSILKYCILLHISEGSTDAANFSAISSADPQKSAPCITAVGYNGVQVWQSEGFVNAETLASSLQKAWLSLHIQETILTAALVSENSDPQNASNFVSTTFQQGSSSGMNIASPSVPDPAESLEHSDLNGLEIENNRSLNRPDKDQQEMDIKLGKKASPGLVSASTLGGQDDLATSSIDRCKASLAPDKSDENNTELGDKATEDKWDHEVNDGKINSVVKMESSQVCVEKETECSRNKKVDIVQDEKINESESLCRSTEVHLNIRLLDGATLQNKFLLTSTLKMVKHYVDENQGSVGGSYDLAIPYPRKVFNDRDLDQTMSELGLVGRQALIVVRPDQGSSSSRGQRSSTSDSDSPNINTERYFSFVKRILSYVNPLSYLGGGAGSSNSAQETPGNVWQYGPKPGTRNTLRGTDAVSSSNQSTLGTGRNNSSTRTTSHFGSNIHTLKHDDDSSQTGDRNKFWNGNSTQYGGDNDRK